MNNRTSKEAIRHGVVIGMFVSLSIVSLPGAAITLEELAAKVERLEAENRVLKEQVGKLASSQAATQPAAVAVQAAAPAAPSTGRIGNGVTFHSQHTYQMLDPTTYINRKQLLLLESRKSGDLAENSFTLGGAITAVVDRQSANINGAFGYLMRQPGNAVGRDASEAEWNALILLRRGVGGDPVMGQHARASDGLTPHRPPPARSGAAPPRARTRGPQHGQRLRRLPRSAGAPPGER